MEIASLACQSCETAVTGHFQQCEFCALDDAQRDLLRVFLASRGNTREIERFLGVSYPTARARLDELLASLGFAAPAPDRRADKLAVLHALAAGDIDVSEAMTKLG